MTESLVVLGDLPALLDRYSTGYGEISDLVVALADDRQKLREWIAATVLMVELNALDAEGIEGIRRSGKELLDG